MTGEWTPLPGVREALGSGTSQCLSTWAGSSRLPWGLSLEALAVLHMLPHAEGLPLSSQR